MAAALISVLSGRIRRWKYTPKQLNNQQRGQHRRLGNALWAALAGCIMPPNLFGHTMSGLHVRQAAVAGVASSQDPFHEL